MVIVKCRLVTQMRCCWLVDKVRQIDCTIFRGFDACGGSNVADCDANIDLACATPGDGTDRHIDCVVFWRDDFGGIRIDLPKLG